MTEMLTCATNNAWNLMKLRIYDSYATYAI